MRVLRNEDLAPDGLLLVVDWDHLPVGGSFFAPCINTPQAIKQVRAIFAGRGWTPAFRVGIENHILGVRVWRKA